MGRLSRVRMCAACSNSPTWGLQLELHANAKFILLLCTGLKLRHLWQQCCLHESVKSFTALELPSSTGLFGESHVLGSSSRCQIAYSIFVTPFLDLHCAHHE